VVVCNAPSAHIRMKERKRERVRGGFSVWFQRTVRGGESEKK
jgi:hypothetical protein